MSKTDRVFILTEQELRWQDTFQIVIGMILGSSFTFILMSWERFKYSISWLVGWIL